MDEFTIPHDDYISITNSHDFTLSVSPWLLYTDQFAQWSKPHTYRIKVTECLSRVFRTILNQTSD